MLLGDVDASPQPDTGTDQWPRRTRKSCHQSTGSSAFSFIFLRDRQLTASHRGTSLWVLSATLEGLFEADPASFQTNFKQQR